MTPSQVKANDIATSGGALIYFNLLNVSSLRQLYKAWMRLKRLPHKCVWKEKYNINHALTCKTRGIVTFHHNEIVNITAHISLHMQRRMERTYI